MDGPPGAYLRQRPLGALVRAGPAQLQQLPGEEVPRLGEASAGGLHQSLQDGADVGLDADLQQLLRLGEHHRCEEEGRAEASEPAHASNRARLEAAPLILLVTCSFDVMIWSMSVRMEASREERAAAHLCTSSSYWDRHWPCTSL